VVYLRTLFWDGRATSLESQAILPLLNSREHGLGSEADVLIRVRQIPQYRPLFDRWLGLGHQISISDVTTAIATYERTLLSGDSAFDRYLYGADPNAMSSAAIRGLELFRNRGHCENCHTIGKDFALFSDQGFHSSPLGIPAAVNATLVELTQRVSALHRKDDNSELNALVIRDPAVAALGRFIVTLDPRDIGLFKTPSLRNVALTAPYFHDGSATTLNEAIDLELYSRGDVVRYPIVMSATEKADLIEFLKALSSPLVASSCVASP
jgi:cytochrome c peroxidase